MLVRPITFYVFFNKLDMRVKLKLFMSYCSSFFGCELWSLNSPNIEYFCVAWRKALKRILGLPYNCRSYLLPLISNTLPIFDEICKRAMRFVISCLSSPNKLVSFVASYCVAFGRYNSILGSNSLFCCERFKLQFNQLSTNINVNCFNNNIFRRRHEENLSDIDWMTAEFLIELLSIRDGYSSLPTDFFTDTQLNDIIIDVATA